MTFQTAGRRLSLLVVAAGAVAALSGCVAYPYGGPAGYGYGYGGYGYGSYGYAGAPAVVVGPGYGYGYGGYGYRPGDRGDWHGGDRGNWSQAAQSRGASPPPPSRAGGGGVTPRSAPYRNSSQRANPGGPEGGATR
jgi:hypothetical protein